MIRSLRLARWPGCLIRTIGVLLAEIRSIPPDAGWLVGLVDDLVEASWTCREAFERVMAARHRFGAGTLPPLTRVDPGRSPGWSPS